jgi:hypothetical protein
VKAELGQAHLPGSEIVLIRADDGITVSQVVTDSEGRFSIKGLVAGTYIIQVSLEGFSLLVQDAVLEPGKDTSLDLLLKVAGVDQSVDVVAESDQVPETGSSEASVEGEMVNIMPVRGDDYSSLLPLVPGVLRATDGRLIMKGGRPTQSSLVVNNSNNVTDPVTGDAGFNLPVDAIETLNVLPNPYAAEFGRFSSGMTNILTRQGTNKWKFLINNFVPRPKWRDGTIMGLGAWKPRFSVRGPIIKDRLFLNQTLQYRYIVTEIPSSALPELERDTKLETFATFTQFDLNLNDGHSLSGLISVFPQKLDFANLDTFNPQEVTANMHSRGHNLGLSDRYTFSPTVVLESTVSFKRYDVDIYGQGLEEMTITPDQNQGNFFNLQRRNARTWQWVEQLSLLKEGWGGQHLFKFGLDLLNNRYDGQNWSRPVNVQRADGSLSQRITFSDPTKQNISATDVAVFAQDRWRPSDRLLLELGLRLDRDGVLGRNNLAPRTGFVFSLKPEGKSVIRGGAGLFYDRTPLTVGAFEFLETRTVEFFDQQQNLTGPPVDYPNQKAKGLHTPYSFTWNLEYDHRITDKVTFKTNFLRRKGFHEYLIDPFEGPNPQLRLDSRGRSQYQEWELTTRYQINPESHLLFSYVLSEALQDLNDLDTYFGNFRRPLIRPNEYTYADFDARHRFIFQGTAYLPKEWILSPVLEIRSGFPVSHTNEEQFYVGLRNRAGRFPHLAALDIDLQKWFKIGRWKTRIGVRFFNIFNKFNPRDFQGNIDSPSFGTFYNPVRRIIGGTLQIEP